MEELQDTLDLSDRKLKKLGKPTQREAQVCILILDNNELQRLDNVDSFVRLQKLSAVNNQLLRMYGVCRLHNLHTLNLSYNGILTIEGLKELTGLKCLQLAGNSIKAIEHLNANINLNHIDLSKNSITHISDISFLKNLKELYLHNNKISHLSQCDHFLPTSLTTLTLADNNITDLNEISRLSHLINLTTIAIANNPCVKVTSGNIGFDYRPFVINWCMSVKVIDDYVVDAIESLRAEWLYSQGRGRHFRVGDQNELIQYLAAVCPLTEQTLETEEDRKLKLILSKAQHHQQQLREQSSVNVKETTSPLTRKRHQNGSSPRSSSSRLSYKHKSPDRMSSSLYSTQSANENYFDMAQSLDPSMLRQNSVPKSMMESFSSSFISQKSLVADADTINSPLQALSKMVPVPESLMSPDYRPSHLMDKFVNSNSSNQVKPYYSKVRTTRSFQPESSNSNYATQTNTEFVKSGSPLCRMKKVTNCIPCNSEDDKKQGSDEESEICDVKLQTIQMKAEKRREQRDLEIVNNTNCDDELRKAATLIQKTWRGYYTRNKNKEVQNVFQLLQNQRASQYIQQLASDMETTKAALESERKIQMLQTEAIGALWQRISSLQENFSEGDKSASVNNVKMSSSVDNPDVVRELAQTCTTLQNQITQLQTSMQDVAKVMSLFIQSSVSKQNPIESEIATQTEIVAVHTPQEDAAKVFPFHKSHQLRPSSLPLPVIQKKKELTQNIKIHNELKQFAGNLVDGVIKNMGSNQSELQDFADTITTKDVDREQ